MPESQVSGLFWDGCMLYYYYTTACNGAVGSDPVLFRLHAKGVVMIIFLHRGTYVSNSIAHMITVQKIGTFHLSLMLKQSYLRFLSSKVLSPTPKQNICNHHFKWRATSDMAVREHILGVVKIGEKGK